jgi:hypothetical protein
MNWHCFSAPRPATPAVRRGPCCLLCARDERLTARCKDHRICKGLPGHVLAASGRLLDAGGIGLAEPGCPVPLWLFLSSHRQPPCTSTMHTITGRLAHCDATLACRPVFPVRRHARAIFRRAQHRRGRGRGRRPFGPRRIVVMPGAPFKRRILGFDVRCRGHRSPALRVRQGISTPSAAVASALALARPIPSSHECHHHANAVRSDCALLESSTSNTCMWTTNGIPDEAKQQVFLLLVLSCFFFGFLQLASTCLEPRVDAEERG